MRDRLEETDHVRYVEVKFPGRRAPLTYHTYDWSLGEGDEVEACGGVLEGRVGEVRRADVEPPTRFGSLIYTYRVKRARSEVEVVTLTYSDGTQLRVSANEFWNLPAHRLPGRAI